MILRSISTSNGIFNYCGTQGLTEVGTVLESCSISRGVNQFLVGSAALILLLTRK